MKRKLFFVGVMLVALGLPGIALGTQDYDVPYLSQPPEIDGKVGSDEWKNAQKIDHLSLFDLHRIKAWGQDPRDNQIYLGYDEANLYIGLKLAKRNPAFPETENWQDDAVDIMLNAFEILTHEFKYFQLIVGQGKIIFQRYWAPWYSSGSFWAKESVIASNTANTDYYETEFKIPFKEIYPEKINAGHTIQFNVARTWSGDARRHWPFYQVTSSLSEKFVRNCQISGLCKLHLLPKGKAAAPAKFVSTQAAAGAKLPAIRSRQFNFYLSARFMPTYDSIWISELSVQSKDDLKKTATVDLSLRDCNGNVRKLAELPTKRKYTKLHYAVPGLPKGKHTLTAQWKDAQGKIAAAESFTFAKNDRPFLHSTIGLSKRILPPYKPLKMERPDTVATITTTFCYNALALPESIRIQQEEPTVGEAVENVLASPITFSVEVSGAKKTKFFATNGKTPSLKKNSGDGIQFAGEACASGLKLQLDNQIDYDGLNRIAVTLAPEKNPVEINDFTLDIPLAPEQATLLHVIGDRNRFALAQAIPADKREIWNSLYKPNTCLYGNFKPMIWIGNEDRGLAWYADTDLGWAQDGKKAAQELLRIDGKIHLRVHFISKKTRIDAPRTITFCLLPTPPKTLPENWKSYEVTSAVKKSNYYPDWTFYPPLPNLRRFEMIADHPPLNSAVWARVPEDWTQAQEFVDRVRKQTGGNIMKYCCLDLSGGEIAEEFRGEWSYGQQGNFMLPTASRKFYGKPEENAIKYTHWFINWRARSYQDYAAWSLNEFLKHIGNFAYYEDNESIRNVYTDDAALLHFGEFAGGNGGFTDERGKLHRKVLITELREYNRRMATVYDENNMENLLTVHKSTQMQIPAFSFVTFALDGEQKPLMKLSDGDYIDLFPLDYVRAHIMGRQFGVIPIWLDQIKVKDVDCRIARSFVALCMLHEVTMWNGWMYRLDPAHMKLPQDIWKLKSDFNFRKQTEFFSYWGKGKHLAYKADSDKIKINCWKQADRTLAVVVNLGEKGTFNIDLDMSKLCNGKNFTVKDWESKQNIAENTGRFRLTIPRHDFRILWIE